MNNSFQATRINLPDDVINDLRAQVTWNDRGRITSLGKFQATNISSVFLYGLWNDGLADYEGDGWAAFEIDDELMKAFPDQFNAASFGYVVLWEDENGFVTSTRNNLAYVMMLQGADAEVEGVEA